MDRQSIIDKMEMLGLLGDYRCTTDKKHLSKYKGEATSLKLPNIFQRLGSSAFEGNKHLVEIETNNRLRVIDYRAFYNCQSLTKVELNKGLIAIGENAFGYSNITSLELPRSLELLEKRAFYGCPLQDLYIRSEKISLDTIYEAVKITPEGKDRIRLHFPKSIKIKVLEEFIQMINSGQYSKSNPMNTTGLIKRGLEDVERIFDIE